ncbi:MAG: prolyl oligopeptidase family serine peptidase [Pseudomonadota bacterium]
MKNEFLYPELETDKTAIAAFNDAQSARTEAQFCDADYHREVARAVEILEDDSYLRGVVQRGEWLYNFLHNADHPKGLWRRIPATETPTIDSAWQPVFDLDAFCTRTGEDWHWRGAVSAYFDPECVLLALSWKGSDQTRYLEWDPLAQMPVPGGFDLGPERNDVNWSAPGELLYSTSTGEGAATRSGWAGRVLRLKRGMALADAPVVFEAEPEDLLAFAFAHPASDGATLEATVRFKAIGDSEAVLHPEGIGGPAIALPSPANTYVLLSPKHYAYIAADEGPDPPGALVLCEVGGTTRRVVFTPRPYCAVDHFMVRHEWLIWIETDRMQPSICALDLRRPDAEPVTIAPPCEAETMYLGEHDPNLPWDGPLQLTTSGFLQPQVSWIFEMKDEPSDIIFRKLTETKPLFDASGMEVRLESAVSEDGTEVPYHIVLPKDREGSVPVLQYGYGGFAASMAPFYHGVLGTLWLSRGNGYVLAYIRGGGEFGTDWHHAAKGHARHKAFEDFAAVAADLTQKGYTTTQQLACHGGSNGGLLCSVMLTRYPERFGAVWASVSVTDMLRFHLFPAGAAWIDEYGDPDDPKDREMLLRYSPMHNVANNKERAYPVALIDTNDSDDRVDPSHSRRFSAALAEAGQPFWFHTKSGGHGGGGSTLQQAQDAALGYAFLRHALGAG